MRFYRLLLHLYPASFRHEYGEEMCRILGHRRRAAAGALGLLALWAACWEILPSAARVHWRLLVQDLRYMARSLRRAPGFALTAIPVIALGIGATTAAFSIADFVLLRPLPFPEPERLVRVWESLPGYPRLEPSPANYRDWRRLSRSFAGMGAAQAISLNLVGPAGPERLEGAAVSAELFPLLGVRPMLGRLFTASDDRDGAAGTVLLSFRLWQREFGGDRAVLGRRVLLDGAPYTVVGVMPRELAFPRREALLWTPLRLSAEDFKDRTNYALGVVARLRRGVSLEQAQAEMRVVAAQLERQYPKENRDTGAPVERLRDGLPEQSRLLLVALCGAALCVLLIACANLANLLLARALARRQELDVRAALGAGRERLVRQLVTESLTLAFLGGALGVLVAMAGLPLLARLVPVTLPLAQAPAVDLPVLLFAGLLTTLTGIGFGTLPALRASQDADLGGLRQGVRAGGGRRERLRSVLVVAEVAAAVVLLVSAGLLLRALVRIQATDPGLSPERRPHSPHGATDAEIRQHRPARGVLLAGADGGPGAPGGLWRRLHELPADGDARRDLAGFALRRARGPGGRSLGEPAVCDSRVLRRPGGPAAPGARRRRLGYRRPAVRGGGERLVRPPLLAGGRPARPALPVRVPRPHGRRRRGGRPGARLRADERAPGLSPLPAGAGRRCSSFFMPKDLVIRTARAARDAGEPGTLLPAVRRIVRAADPEQPISDVRTLSEIVADETASRAVQVRVLGAFAAIAFLLAAIGIYGLLSFAVAERAHEIGVRMALGARAGEILGMVLRQGALLAVAGAIPGAALAYAAGRAMASLLAGLDPGDLATFLTAVGLCLLMTLFGSLWPALRAVRVDPIRVIRKE